MTRLLMSPQYSRTPLSHEALMRYAPAVFASHQFDRTGANYVFISTQELIDALRDEGFHAVAVSQRRSRGDRLGYARHMIRFQPADAGLRVVDCTPEIILINSHDASSAWELRGGLYRSVCCNGLITPLSEFSVIRVPHRGNVIASVVEGARKLTDQLGGIGQVIERMVATELDEKARHAFAQRALEFRFRHQDRFPFDADQLLEARQEADRPNHVWAVYNRVQQNVIGGGVSGRTARGRRTLSRPIREIREEVRLNVALWQEAMQLIRAS
jgi:hypothetical protein